jgi:hypothetical protein
MTCPTTTAREVMAKQETFRDDDSRFAYQRLIQEICGLNWQGLTRHDLINIAWVYYYFSIQFRENLEIARNLFPDDSRLRELDEGERNTDNLSPWPGVANPGERMHHDEFMRRTLQLARIDKARQLRLTAIGSVYLKRIRAIDRMTRALSLASYEDGGLERVFRMILTALDWDDPLLEAFKHFLTEHIKFDSDPEHGHGAICRHLTPDDTIVPLWSEFRTMLIWAAPRLDITRVTN